MDNPYLEGRSRGHAARILGRIRALPLLVLATMLYGCGTGEALPTAIPVPQAATPTGAAQAATTAPAATVAPDGTWVPPTALVGTPRPGAVATLTAAPALKTGNLSLINANGFEVVIHVEIADTQQARQLGLMHRTQMDPDAGMLFDFGGPATGGFWMQNTLLPLSIAFIAEDGTILNIEDMAPLDLNTTEPAGTYFYALEANQGYFQANNIVPGSKVLLPVKLDGAGGSAASIPGMPVCAARSAY